MSEIPRKMTKSKRLGFGRACNACRKRKHRCDAIEPQCSGCRSRGNTCEYSFKITHKGSIVHVQEGSLGYGQATVIDHPNVPLPPDSSMGSYSPDLSVVARRRLSGSSVVQGDHGQGREAVGLDRSSIPFPSTGAATAQLVNPSGYFGDSSAINFVSVARNGEQHSPIGVDNESTQLSLPEDIATHYGSSSPREGLEHFKLLPDRSEGNQLVDAYFARVHLLYPFVHETSFRSHYEQTWIGQGPPDIAWLAVVNIVFAYGCEFCSCPEGVDPVQRASQFVERAKQIILYQVFKAASLHLSQALLLLCHYLQGALELNEAWNFFGLAIRSSMSIGLHINPPADGSTLTTVDRELRKRIWWGCFVLDRTLSMKFGRPPSIIMADAFDVDLPAEVDDQYITDTLQFPRQPGGQPARISAFVQTIGLSRVIDSIMSMLYLKRRNKRDDASGSAGTSTKITVQEDFHLLGNMLLLDGQLQAWWNSVPNYLSDNDKLSDMSEGVSLTRQRNVLYIRYMQMRLLLLRPSILLLCKEDFHDPFLYAVATQCAKRCVSAALETIQLIHQKYRQQQLHSVWYILHCARARIPVLIRHQDHHANKHCADVFSSLGVLIAAQRSGVSASWDPSERPVSAIFTQGMEFLRSASKQSSIAHRYVLLLGRHFHQLSSDQNNSNNNAVSRLGLDAEVVSEPDLPPAAPVDPENEQAATGHDPASIGFPDLNDFLFGMGLPQDFLATDWLLDDMWAT